VATFASQLDLGMSSFFASAAATIGQVMLLDYGLGANWGNLTIRLHALNRYISQMLPAQQCDWVVFVDCYDSVIIGKEADICVRLERLEADSGRSVFFGAETWKGDLVDEQEAHAKQMNVNGPWRFLNAGLMAGRVWALRDFLSVPIQEDANDQVFVTEVMLYHKPQLATLDYRSELFLNAYGIEGILDGPWAEELLQPAGSVVFVEAEGRRWIENRLMKSRPIVLHFPGPGKFGKVTTCPGRPWLECHRSLPFEVVRLFLPDAYEGWQLRSLQSSFDDVDTSRLWRWTRDDYIHVQRISALVDKMKDREHMICGLVTVNVCAVVVAFCIWCGMRSRGSCRPWPVKPESCEV